MTVQRKRAARKRKKIRRTERARERLALYEEGVARVRSIGGSNPADHLFEEMKAGIASAVKKSFEPFLDAVTVTAKCIIDGVAHLVVEGRAHRPVDSIVLTIKHEEKKL